MLAANKKAALAPEATQAAKQNYIDALAAGAGMQQLCPLLQRVLLVFNTYLKAILRNFGHGCKSTVGRAC